MVRATHEGLRKLMKNKRPFTITRAGYLVCNVSHLFDR